MKMFENHCFGKSKAQNKIDFNGINVLLWGRSVGAAKRAIHVDNK